MPSASQEEEKLESLFNAGGYVKQQSDLGKRFGRFLKC